MPIRDTGKTSPLDQQICFQLYLASRNLIRAYQPILNELDLTYPQYLVMIVLWESQSASVKSLGKKLGLDSGTLSPLIKRLIEKGLLTKERDPNDERGVIVSLTKAGIAAEVKASCIPSQLIEETGLEPSDLTKLFKPLKDLNRKLTGED